EGRHIDPNNMHIINTLGSLYAAMGRNADAERVLTEGRRIDPNDIHIINTLGSLYAAMGRNADAERVLTEGRRINPDDLYTINVLGNFYLHQQRYEDFNKLFVETRSAGKDDAVYLTVVAKGALLQHKRELARRAAYAALHIQITASAAALYVAAADSDDFLLPKLSKYFGEKFQEIIKQATAMKGDPSLIDELDPGLAPRTSPVLVLGGTPVNRAAAKTFRNNRQDRSPA
ncbi:MAG: hypothetical protein KGI37_11330, partial [Alphaproteobacteria bacterium]|nr:hypothetical protein [Alphaproteobacteria bacterium]